LLQQNVASLANNVIFVTTSLKGKDKNRLKI